MSTTILGLFAGVFAEIAKRAGVNLGNEQITDFILTGVQVLVVVRIYMERIKKGDVNLFGIKK